LRLGFGCNSTSRIRQSIGGGILMPKTMKKINGNNGGDDGARTRDLRRDRPAF
jgi:hypothetical protein